MRYFEAHDITEYKDADGNIPEILMIDGNRTAGKTTAFSAKFVRDFLEQDKKFMLLYRYQAELSEIAESFFKDIHVLFFPGHEMTERKRANGSYIELFIDGNSCGYAVALNTAEKLKHYSHIFSDVEQILFDEYQLENGFYLNKELEKFQSLHMTVSRGRGKAVRFVPVYMLSNSVSIFNPYYDAFGIAKRINSKTKMLRGHGFVLLRLTIKEIAKEQEKSAFNRAFAGTQYLTSAKDNSFLNDDTYNIKKISVAGYRAEFVILENKKMFVFYSYGDLYHVRKGGPLPGIPVFGVYQSDRNGEARSIRYSYIFGKIQALYSNGLITFADTEAKRVFLDLLFDS